MTLEVGQRVYDHRRRCGAVVEEIGTNPIYPDRVLVRYDRMLSERLPMLGVQSFGMDWVLPEWVEAIEKGEG